MTIRTTSIARFHRPPALLLAGSIAALLASPFAQAANTPSTFNSGTDLLTPANWSAGLPSVTVDAIFDTGFPASAATFTISAGALTVGSLNDLSLQPIILSNQTTGGTNSTLTLGGASSTGNAVSGAVSGDLIYIGGATSGLTIKGANDASGTGLLNVVLGSNGNFNVANSGAALTISAAISGAFNLNKTGAGTLTLSGANTFGGSSRTITLTAGTLNINNATALGNVSNTFTINGGVIDNTSGAALTTGNYAQIWNADFTFAGGTGTTHDLNLGTGVVSLGTAAGTARTVTVTAGTLTIGGAIINGTTATGLTKAGAGDLTLAGGSNSAYSGITKISGGRIVVSVTNALRNSTLDYDNYGGTLVFSGITAPQLGGLQGSQNLTLANAAGTALQITVGNNNQSTTYSGNLTGLTAGVGRLDKTGSGTLTLSGTANTYGLTYVFGGTLNVTGGLGTMLAQNDKLTVAGGVANLSGTVVLKSALAAGDVGATGTINVTGGSVTLTSASNGIYIGNGATNAAAVGGTVSISGGAVTTTSTAAILVGGGGSTGATFNGAAVLNLSGTGLLDTGTTTGTFRVGSSTATNTSGTGTLNLDGGTLATNRSITGGTVAASTVNFNGGTFRANGTAATLSGFTTAQVRNGGAIIDTQSFAVSIAQSFVHSGVAGDNATDGGLTKNGTGTLTLGGTNTYTGLTTINQGTLLVSGSISGSTSVATAGSTLGGTGTVGAVSVSSGAILAGGAGTAASGALTTTGSVSLADGALIQLTLGAAGAHSSLQKSGGTWAFDLDQAFVFNLLASATATTYDDIITGLTGSETGLASIGTWTIQNPGVTGTFFYDTTNHSIDLVLTAIPEPSSLATLFGGLGSLLGLQRFRRRAIR